ncbi:MAG: MFS transporter [Alicyclobacillus sp.]|nr:MFS transporter [Alicyclobacillus sp.]
MTLWRHRDFLKLWAGQTVSEIGSRITREGLPMGAVMMMGVSPLVMSGLSLATQLPASLLGLLIGVWVDRLRRRPLMVTADLARALLLLVIPIAAWSGALRLWMFFMVAAVIGVLGLLFDVAYQAYLPWLIDKERLVEGNSKLGVTAAFAEIVGPGLTGLLVQALTAPVAIVFDAASYVVSAVALLGIRRHEPRVRGQIVADVVGVADVAGGAALGETPRQWRRELRDGLRVLRRDRALLALAGAAATTGFASSPIFVLDTLYALKTLHLTAWQFGLTVTTGGLGGLLGAALAKRVVGRVGLGRAMIGMLLLQGLAAGCWVVAGGPVWRVMACLLTWQLVGDCCGTIYGVLDVTLRQTLVPDSLLGRVNGAMRVADIGLTAVGTIGAGVVAQAFGIRITMVLATAGMLLSTLWLVFSPIRRLEQV